MTAGGLTADQLGLPACYRQVLSAPPTAYSSPLLATFATLCSLCAPLPHTLSYCPFPVSLFLPSSPATPKTCHPCTGTYLSHPTLALAPADSRFPTLHNENMASVYRRTGLLAIQSTPPWSKQPCIQQTRGPAAALKGAGAGQNVHTT